MAKKDNSQQTTSAETAAFTKGLVRDYDENFDPQNSWSYARNAVNNSTEGDLGALGNEPSNVECGAAPYTVIGKVHLFKQYWMIASTNDTNSEIGLYDENLCTYWTIVNDNCLGFKKTNLISGVSKENFDCSWSVYFADGLNPDRIINIGNPDLWLLGIPYIGANYYQGNKLWPGVAWNQSCTELSDCITCTDLNSLNCELIRMSKIVNTPCIKLSMGDGGGNLSNGSYIAVIAYTIQGQKYGDYSSPSNVQSIFYHNNIAGSLKVEITNLDTERFSEFQLIVLSTVGQATTARIVGTYSTTNNATIQLDYIDETLPNIPVADLPIINNFAEKSDRISNVSNYLLRIGPTSRYDFNYQPLANQIDAEWVICQYPANYYKKGGNVTGYMRDEVYPFFIRWIYNTGEKSKSYHIPGRIAEPGETTIIYTEGIYDGGEYIFEAQNTASIDALPIGITESEDGGIPIAHGKMAYWESSETYPDKQPEIWNSSNDPQLSGTVDPDYDLCGKPIRHHKMPEDIINNLTTYTRATATGNSEAQFINILGVRFKNIKPPVYRDQNGNIKVVEGIVGYEILRGSRKGNKSVVAKGIINNMRRYDTASGDVGLYPNFPYNPVKATYSGGSSGIVDPTLSLTPVEADGDNYSIVDENHISKRNFTFHSPETSFSKPFLSTKELRLYTEVGAPNNVFGQFEEVPNHPKHKILTDLSLITSLLVGMGEAVLAMKGKTVLNTDGPRVLNIGLGTIPATTQVAAPGSYATGFAMFPSPVASGTLLASNAAINTAGFLSDLLGGDFINSITGLFEPTNAFYTAYAATDAGIGVLGRARGMSNEQSAFDSLPTIFKVGGGIITFFNLAGTAAENNLALIEALVKYQQYAVRYISHGILHRDNVGNISLSKRSKINDAAYLDNQFNTFAGVRVNNLYRSSTVGLNVNSDIANPNIIDDSICSIGTNHAGITYTNPFVPFNSTASCYYAGIKLRYRNQYGQLQSIEQIPVPCPVTQLGDREQNDTIPQSVILTGGPVTLFLESYSSPILFGGDIYIGRYTEKNTFFYFADWLYNEPDGTSFDYRLRYLGLYPRYWADLGKYDLDGFLFSVTSNFLTPDNWNTPANTNNLDGQIEASGGFGLSDFGQLSSYRFVRKNAYFYLFQSGVRDFYVESEINIDQRDWGELPEEKYYPILSDLSELFNTNIIKSGNYFKIDASVSVSRLFTSVGSWGYMQDRNYNPVTSSFCYQYTPNRIIYSLPDTLESKRDAWAIYLANNYKDFKSRVTTVKPIGKSGALVLFENDSPVMFQGTETLETDIGTKLVIGDGGLFLQPMQSTVNADEPYEYGSCQDSLSVINTPVGIYWMSQNQGKIFSMVGGINELSSKGMRWWFAKFLPYRLLEDFPDFEVIDNPVVGIGCQAAYDNDEIMLYFCKRDYELRKDLPEDITLDYIGGINFKLNGANILLGDPRYFKDVSWTVSFDPKMDAWISFHDWHPDLTIPSRLNLITTKNNKFWRHNETTSSYCNYYGVDYPFSVEYNLDTGQIVNTLRSIEYIVEAYVYDAEGIDRFHVLDANFDKLIVSNTEQVSGLLNLVLAPKNDPFARVSYPIVNIDSIDVLFDKVEQKYRVNQFWDITADRGEFNPNAQRPIWITDWDGYKIELNPLNLDYAKSVFQLKPFRHYYNRAMFTKEVSGNLKMLVKLANDKNLMSPR